MPTNSCTLPTGLVKVNWILCIAGASIVLCINVSNTSICTKLDYNQDPKDNKHIYILYSMYNIRILIFKLLILKITYYTHNFIYYIMHYTSNICADCVLIYVTPRRYIQQLEIVAISSWRSVSCISNINNTITP